MTVKESWTRQRIANRVPPWTDAGLYPHSHFQQFLNPMGNALDDLNKFAAEETDNVVLASANLDLPDIFYKVSLPSDFEFSYDDRNLSDPAPYAPNVKATTGSTTLWVSTPEENTIESFWFDSLPTRVTDLATTVLVDDILDTTYIEDLDDAAYNTIREPNRLVVEVAGCEDFIDVSRIEAYSFIVITGTTERGLEETERMIIPYNGTFLTTKIWSEVTSVEQYGLTPEDTGTITISPFMFNLEREPDKYSLYVDMLSEKVMYHGLEDKVLNVSGPAYSVQKHMTMAASNLESIFAGEDELQTIREIELMYNDQNLQLTDIAVQPFTGKLFAIDDNYLYIFDPYSEYVDCRDVEGKSNAPQMIIETDYYDYIRGDEIEMRPYWRKPVKPISWTRWSVQKPDGTFRYLMLDSSLTTSAEQAKIGNESYSAIEFGPFITSTGSKINRQDMSHTLDQRGTYLFMLETKYVDGVLEKDILPIQTHYKNALTRLSLPAVARNALGLAFDSDQQLWVLDIGSGGYIARKIGLATDNMLVDFDNKVIYLHENYDTVTVYAT